MKNKSTGNCLHDYINFQPNISFHIKVLITAHLIFENIPETTKIELATATNNIFHLKCYEE